MTEGSSAPITENIQNSEPQIEERAIKPLLSAREKVKVAKDIRLAFDGDEVFENSLNERKQQAKIILEGWMKGEITLDEATEIIGSDGAQLDMALETDQLMDIPNRTALERNILEQIALARRNGKPISIAFLDLDQFGDINKRWEEDAGDATLQAVGTFLKSELERPTDRVMRRSGEELVLLLPDTDEKGAIHVLEGMRIRMPESVAQLVKEIGEYEFDRPITFSAGVVTELIDRLDPRKDVDIKTELLSRADSRMRLAKNNGRNQVVGTQAEFQLKKSLKGDS